MGAANDQDRRACSILQADQWHRMIAKRVSIIRPSEHSIPNLSAGCLQIKRQGQAVRFRWQSGALLFLWIYFLPSTIIFMEVN